MSSASLALTHLASMGRMPLGYRSRDRVAKKAVTTAMRNARPQYASASMMQSSASGYRTGEIAVDTYLVGPRSIRWGSGHPFDRMLASETPREHHNLACTSAMMNCPAASRS